MTTSDQTPETELQLQELTDENIEEVIGGKSSPKLMGNVQELIDENLKHVSGGVQFRSSYDLASEASFIDDQKENSDK
jgi:cobalamin biosynthesis protein CobT